MRVLLSTIGSRGDVQPLVALASQLRRFGQEVRLCVPPDFCGWIESLGMSATPIGPELRTMATARPAVMPSPERRRELAEASVATQFEIIAAAAHRCDLIVGATALQMAAPSVADKLGIPYVFAAYSPNVLPSPHHAPPPLPSIPGLPQAVATTDNVELWARDRERFNDLFATALNAHRASIGLAPVDDVRSYVFTDRPWLAADPTLGPWPDSTNETVLQTGAWILADERPLPAELEAFLESNEPPVYFGFGSIRAAQDVGEVMIQTARTLGRRAIVSRGWAALQVDDGADCLAVDEVNQQALFKRVAAVVHHGGAGTTSIAALSGAPQVVIPQMYDQHYWAQRVDRLGIGTAHAPGTPTAATLTDALARALQPQVAARARSIAATIRRDGAQAAAQRLIRGL
jgi:vancomycin aglycone glucosyltransferase